MNTHEREIQIEKKREGTSPSLLMNEILKWVSETRYGSRTHLAWPSSDHYQLGFHQAKYVTGHCRKECPDMDHPFFAVEGNHGTNARDPVISHHIALFQFGNGCEQFSKTQKL